MKKLWVTLTVISVLGSAASFCFAAEEKPQVTVAGIRIVAEGYKDGDQDLCAFSQSKGTAVALMVTLPGGGIVEFKKDESELESMTDDQGGNLLTAAKKGFGSSAGFGFWPKISKDGKVLVIEAVGPDVPKAGAKSIELKGKIVISVGSKTETVENKDVAMTIDSKVQAGGLELDISKVGKPSWGDYKFSLSFKGKGDSSKIKEITFYGADGNEIESNKAGYSSWGENFEWQYQLMEKVDKATVKVELWTDLHDVEIPLNLKTGVGIGE